MSADLRVATYNIHRGIGVDGRLDLERIADVIDRTDTDIVGLQEVDRHYRAATEYAAQLDAVGSLASDRSLVVADLIVSS